jgi:hypothetical protein
MIASGASVNCHEEAGTTTLTRNQKNITASVIGTVVCAAVFVVSLLYQFGWLEGVSCVATWVQLFMLAGTVVDALEEKQASSGKSVLASVVAVFLLLGWLAVDLVRHAGTS